MLQYEYWENLQWKYSYWKPSVEMFVLETFSGNVRTGNIQWKCSFWKPSVEMFVLETFSGNVSYTSDISCRDTRSTNCNQLYTPKPKSELFSKSFMYSGAAIWNSLPLLVKNATSVNTFKCLYLKWKRLNDR